MSTKSTTSSTPEPNGKGNGKRKYRNPGWTHQQLRLELERAIVLMVLSNPSLEIEIVRNYLDRKGYVVQGQSESDQYLHEKYGIPLPGEKCRALHEKWKKEAEELYQRAEEMKAENRSHVLDQIAKAKAPKPGKLRKKGSDVREQNVDRMLKNVLNKVQGGDQNK